MTNQEIAKEVLDGKWGNGQDRRRRLEDAGYNYDAVQSIVNQLVWDRDQGPPEDLPAEPELENIPVYNPEYYLEVEVDMNKYHGLLLKFIN